MLIAKLKGLITGVIVTILLFGVVSVVAADMQSNNNYYIIENENWKEYRGFSEGLCAILDSGTQKWGFIDKTGDYVIPPKFNDAEFFNDGLCSVNIGGLWGLIDRSGNIVWEPNSDASLTYKKHGEYGAIFSSEKAILVNSQMKPILGENIELNRFATTYNSSKAFFYTDAKIYNYKGVDISEKIISSGVKLPTSTYNMGHIYGNNRYLVFRDTTAEKPMVFDIDGNLISSFENGTAKRLSLSTGYQFINNYHVIDNNDTIAVYNIQGNLIKMWDKPKGTFEVSVYGNKYIVAQREINNIFSSALYDIKGNVIVDFGQWDTIKPSLSLDYIIVSSNKKYGVADFYGQMIIPLEYKSVSGLSPNGEIVFFPTPQGSNPFNNVMYNLKTLQQFLHIGTPQFEGNRIYVEDMSSKPLDSKYTILNCDLEVLIDSFKPGRIRTYGEPGAGEGIYAIRQDMRTTGFIIFEDGGGTKVEIDSKLLPFDQPPVIESGRTLVPMRAIFEALGCEVVWNGDNQSILAIHKDREISLAIDNKEIFFRDKTSNGNNNTINLDVAPKILNGRTLVPVRAISEVLDCFVDWNQHTQTVSIYMN